MTISIYTPVLVAQQDKQHHTQQATLVIATKSVCY